MKQMAYVVYREDEFCVSQCLNVDVASFGSTREEAMANLNVGQEFVNA
jgi:predicted RNase H-like HicB family nuclease